MHAIPEHKSYFCTIRIDQKTVLTLKLLQKELKSISEGGFVKRKKCKCSLGNVVNSGSQSIGEKATSYKQHKRKRIKFVEDSILNRRALKPKIFNLNKSIVI